MLVLGSLVMALGFIVYYGMHVVHRPLLELRARQGPECIGAASVGLDSQILFNVGMLVGVDRGGLVASGAA